MTLYQDISIKTRKCFIFDDNTSTRQRYRKHKINLVTRQYSTNKRQKPNSQFSENTEPPPLLDVIKEPTAEGQRL